MFFLKTRHNFRVTTQEVVGLIDSTARSLDVDSNLAIAIAGHESHFDTATARYEPNWKYLVYPNVFCKKLWITQDTEIALQRISWGCMQVMGSVCRELGYLGHLTLLSDPNLGIFYGCKKLFALAKTHSNESDIIASYNAGSPRKDVGGAYVNKNYVDDVTKRLLQLRDIKK